MMNDMGDRASGGCLRGGLKETSLDLSAAGGWFMIDQKDSLDTLLIIKNLWNMLLTNRKLKNRDTSSMYRVEINSFIKIPFSPPSESPPPNPPGIALLVWGGGGPECLSTRTPPLPPQPPRIASLGGGVGDPLDRFAPSAGPPSPPRGLGGPAEGVGGWD
jgi:hypothetical protein